MKLDLSIAATLGLAIAVGLLPFAASAAKPPTRVGACADTFVARVGTRLVDGSTGQSIAGSGTAISFTNGISLISYDTVPNAAAARPGDKAKLCLQSIPKNCPPGDNRGKVYQATIYRTGKRFALPDSQHMCGGA